jgi:hypothetical protein
VSSRRKAKADGLGLWPDELIISCIESKSALNVAKAFSLSRISLCSV